MPLELDFSLLFLSSFKVLLVLPTALFINLTLSSKPSCKIEAFVSKFELLFMFISVLFLLFWITNSFIIFEFNWVVNFSFVCVFSSIIIKLSLSFFSNIPPSKAESKKSFKTTLLSFSTVSYFIKVAEFKKLNSIKILKIIFFILILKNFINFY